MKPSRSPTVTRRATWRRWWWLDCRNPAHQISTDIPGEEIAASHRALERAEAIVHAELKRGVSGLATIASSAPFVGLFGTVAASSTRSRAFRRKSRPAWPVAGGISEALVTTAIGLFVAVPAVWAYNYLPAGLKRSTWKWATPVPS